MSGADKYRQTTDVTLRRYIHASYSGCMASILSRLSVMRDFKRGEKFRSLNNHERRNSSKKLDQRCAVRNSQRAKGAQPSILRDVLRMCWPDARPDSMQSQKGLDVVQHLMLFRRLNDSGLLKLFLRLMANATLTIKETSDVFPSHKREVYAI